VFNEVKEMESMKAIRWVFVALVILMLGGCFIITDGPTASLQVVNTSGFTIYYIYISPDASADWGPDQLGSANTIPSGTTFTFTDITPGTYDLEARAFGNVAVIKSTYPAPGITFLGDQTYIWVVD
jgi:hypothetical protein